MSGKRLFVGKDDASVTAAIGREALSGIIAITAIIMFARSSVDMFVSELRGVTGINGGNDPILAATLLLNIALVLFSWRRYRDVQNSMQAKEEAEQRVTELQTRDVLTGLLNRTGLMADGEALAQHSVRRHRSTALIMVDLDNFKNINDLHGHDIGDMLLGAVADRLQAVPLAGAVLGRVGGDEFAIMFHVAGDGTEATDVVADKIVRTLARPFEINGAVIAISGSIGIAGSDIDGSTVDLLFRQANIAMRTAKRRGKNRVVWFDVSMEQELRARNYIEQGMREGIPKGQFVPYFEKQVDLESGTLRGFEVLARWKHPVNGIVMPEVFIPVAEETGMIGDLSMSIMRQAFERARDWNPDLTLSVNIAPGQLKDPWLAQKILKLLVETGFQPNRLEVEITESSLFENLSLAQSTIGSLKNQGVSLALDDFGTGYSSLAHLRSLPFDRIKIDKGFVMSMAESRDNEAIVTAIAKLGESMNLHITAEGIEDVETLATLKAIGCTKGQGWHYGKPLSGADASRLLQGARTAEPDAQNGLETEGDLNRPILRRLAQKISVA